MRRRADGLGPRLPGGFTAPGFVCPSQAALCAYLSECGARIEGAGSDRLCVRGSCGRPLDGAQFCIPADRIVAGTYLFGCIATGGNVLLADAPVDQMEAALRVAVRMGSRWERAREGIYVQSPPRPLLPEKLRTSPHPGFPTDMQSMALAAMTKGKGQCLIEETIFEKRFRVVEPLREMGADIETLNSRKVSVRGVSRLVGRDVEAGELRGGAALVLAGLMAEGVTRVYGVKYIDRGYENICRDLRELGARIVSV